jgi:hypothetical protein
MSSYRFLQDAYVAGRYYHAGDTASTADVGGSLPANWKPNPNVDPLDAAAVTAFFNVGPQPLGLVRSQFQFVSPPVTRWVETPVASGCQWSLTGLGAGLGPWGGSPKAMLSKRKKLLAAIVVALYGLIAASALAIYGYGLYLASVSNSTPMLICSIVPVFGQLCLIAASWLQTGAFFNAYNIALFVWMGLVTVFANVLVRVQAR